MLFCSKSGRRRRWAQIAADTKDRKPPRACLRVHCSLARGMCVSSRKRARTAGEEEGEAVPVAGGFEVPIFGARVVGQRPARIAAILRSAPTAACCLWRILQDPAGRGGDWRCDCARGQRRRRRRGWRGRRGAVQRHIRRHHQQPRLSALHGPLWLVVWARLAGSRVFTSFETHAVCRSHIGLLWFSFSHSARHAA